MKPVTRPQLITKSREKVLAVGTSGTRKSTSLVQLALLYPDVGVVIIDPDGGIAKIVEQQFGGWSELPNLDYRPANNFEELQEQYNSVAGAMEPGDWLCLDMVGQFYKFAKDHYIETKYGIDALNFTLGKKEANKKLSFQGLSPDDWQLIQMLHDSVVDNAIRRLPCNLMITAKAKPIIFAEKQGAMVPLYSYPSKWVPLKVVPDMEKNIDYAVDTMLYLNARDVREGNTINTEFSFQTVGKDRGRSPVQSPFNTLWSDYCTAVGLDPLHSPGKE